MVKSLFWLVKSRLMPLKSISLQINPPPPGTIMRYYKFAASMRMPQMPQMPKRVQAEAEQPSPTTPGEFSILVSGVPGLTSTEAGTGGLVGLHQFSWQETPNSVGRNNRIIYNVGDDVNQCC